MAIEGEDDVFSSLELLDEFFDGAASFDEVGEVEEAPHFAAEGICCHEIDAGFVCPVGEAAGGGDFLCAAFFIFDLHGLIGEVAEFGEPVAGEGVLEGVQDGGGGFAQVEFAAEGFDVGGGDFGGGKLEVEIHLSATDGAATQADTADAPGEEGAQAADGLTGV